jgi:hypothetical protein
MLKQLLEQESHIWLRREFPELIDVCKEGDTYQKVYENVCEKMKKSVHPVVMDRLKVLRHLLERLILDLEQIKISGSLTLSSKINVMNLSKTPSSIKQLAVHSSIKLVLNRRKRTIVVLDELPDFAPEKYSTPSKSIIMEAIRKGGAKEIWLWLSGQTVTGVEKQVLKQAMIWILGHQREENEAQKTIRQIPFETGLSVDDIMKLPVGKFIVATDDWAYLTYVQPQGLDSETAQKVALGSMSVDRVAEILSKKEKESDDEVKEKYDELSGSFSRLQEEHNLLVKQYNELVEKMEASPSLIEGYEEKINFLTKRMEEVEKDAMLLDELRKLFAKILPAQVREAPMAQTVEVPEISIEQALPSISIQVTRKPLLVSSDSLEGQLALLYSEGFFDGEERSQPQIQHEITQRGYKTDPRLGTKLGDMCTWGFLKRRRTNKWMYTARMTSAEAKEKGLLKTVEGEVA